MTPSKNPALFDNFDNLGNLGSSVHWKISDTKGRRCDEDAMLEQTIASKGDRNGQRSPLDEPERVEAWRIIQVVCTSTVGK